MIGGLALVVADHTEGFGEGVTASLVERMGLFTIIVLGEVVVGVVGGISDAEHRDAKTITTGMIGLTIGMGMWWNYFDMLGRRVPGPARTPSGRLALLAPAADDGHLRQRRGDGEPARACRRQPHADRHRRGCSSVRSWSCSGA